MKTPLVVIVGIVLVVIGFLTFYSQQHGMPAEQSAQEQAAGEK